MLQPSEILLDPSSPTDPPSILQLYRYLELFSEGQPSRNSLFVMARPTLHQTIQGQGASDELLIIDPPPNINERFRLEGNVAALFTGTQHDSDLPRLSTQAGGIAHIRIGAHYLDVYTQSAHAVIHLPALGILVGGSFGSSSLVPDIGPKSDGSEELDTLRLLAGLTKRGRLQLFVPRVGEILRDRVAVMERLAADVAYIHSLRRTAPGLANHAVDPAKFTAVADSLLPLDRHNESSAEIHTHNVRTVWAHSARSC